MTSYPTNKMASDQKDHVWTISTPSTIAVKFAFNTFLTLIDFSKAFDYVQTQYLLNKLHKKGIHGNIYRSIKELYTNPLSCVQLNGHLGGWFPVRAGVRHVNGGIGVALRWLATSEPSWCTPMTSYSWVKMRTDTKTTWCYVEMVQPVLYDNQRKNITGYTCSPTSETTITNTTILLQPMPRICLYIQIPGIPHPWTPFTQQNSRHIN